MTDREGPEAARSTSCRGLPCVAEFLISWFLLTNSPLHRVKFARPRESTTQSVESESVISASLVTKSQIRTCFGLAILVSRSLSLYCGFEISYRTGGSKNRKSMIRMSSEWNSGSIRADFIRGPCTWNRRFCDRPTTCDRSYGLGSIRDGVFRSRIYEVRNPTSFKPFAIGHAALRYLSHRVLLSTFMTVAFDTLRIKDRTSARIFLLSFDLSALLSRKSDLLSVRSFYVTFLRRFLRLSRRSWTHEF